MKTITALQLDALDRIGKQLAELESLTNEFDIEAKVYSIKKIAQDISNKMHAHNSLASSVA